MDRMFRIIIYVGAGVALWAASYIAVVEIGHAMCEVQLSFDEVDAALERGDLQLEALEKEVKRLNEEKDEARKALVEALRDGNIDRSGPDSKRSDSIQTSR